MEQYFEISNIYQKEKYWEEEVREKRKGKEGDKERKK